MASGPAKAQPAGTYLNQIRYVSTVYDSETSSHYWGEEQSLTLECWSFTSDVLIGQHCHGKLLHQLSCSCLQNRTEKYNFYKLSRFIAPLLFLGLTSDCNCQKPEGRVLSSSDPSQYICSVLSVKEVQLFLKKIKVYPTAVWEPGQDWTCTERWSHMGHLFF